MVSSDREGDDMQLQGVAAAGSSGAATAAQGDPGGGSGAMLGPSGARPAPSQKGVVAEQHTGCVRCTAGEPCVLHDVDALGELHAKLAWAAREGQEVSVHVETAYELFGEAVLSWMPLARLGGTIL